MDLEFDINKLTETRQKFSELADELALLKTDVLSDLDKLREDWKTPAGRDFFQNQVQGWAPEVDKYIRITAAMASMLAYAVQEYQTVEDAAKGLKF